MTAAVQYATEPENNVHIWHENESLYFNRTNNLTLLRKTIGGY